MMMMMMIIVVVAVINSDSGNDVDDDVDTMVMLMAMTTYSSISYLIGVLIPRTGSDILVSNFLTSFPVFQRVPIRLFQSNFLARLC